MAERTRLFLIRHGESAAQLAGIVSGHNTCTGLSDRGRAQAQALGARVARSRLLDDVAAIYTSVLPRAIETAAIVAAACGLGVEPVADCGLCELHPGEAEGIRWDQMHERYPVDGDPYDPYLRRVPGMETWAEVYARCGAALSTVAQRHAGETIAVVAHGGTIGASFVEFGVLPVERGVEPVNRVVNTAITEWVLEPTRDVMADDARSSQWHLGRFNDAAHLEGLVYA